MTIQQLEITHVLSRKRQIVVVDNAGRHSVLEVRGRVMPYKGSSVKVDLDGIEQGETVRIFIQQQAGPVPAKLIVAGLTKKDLAAFLGPGIQIHEWE